MPYRIEAVVPAFYRSQTKSASDALSAYHPKLSPTRESLADLRRSLTLPYEEYYAFTNVSRKTQDCREIDPNCLPGRVFLLTDTQPLLDFYKGYEIPAEVFVVSERFRDLIEEYEPGVHQFIAVKMYNKKGNLLRSKYFYLITRNCRFFLDIEKSKLWGKGRGGLSVSKYKIAPSTAEELDIESLGLTSGDEFKAVSLYGPYALHMRKDTFDRDFNLNLKPSLTLRSKDYAGENLWREAALERKYWGRIKYCDKFELFVSDTLFREIMDRGFNGIAAANRAVFDNELEKEGLSDAC